MTNATQLPEIPAGVYVDDLAMCGACEWLDDLACWDVGGADVGNAFCIQCNAEQDIDLAQARARAYVRCVSEGGA